MRLNVRASELTSSPPASVARTSVRPSPSARAACSRVRSRLWAGLKINSAVTVAPTAEDSERKPGERWAELLEAQPKPAAVFAGTATSPSVRRQTTIASNIEAANPRPARAGQKPFARHAGSPLRMRASRTRASSGRQRVRPVRSRHAPSPQDHEKRLVDVGEAGPDERSMSRSGRRASSVDTSAATRAASCVGVRADEPTNRSVSHRNRTPCASSRIASRAMKPKAMRQ